MAIVAGSKATDLLLTTSIHSLNRFQKHTNSHNLKAYLITQFLIYMITIPLLLLGIVPTCLAHRYALQDETIGHKFFHDFDHEAINDPTHGRVE